MGRRNENWNNNNDQELISNPTPRPEKQLGRKHTHTHARTHARTHAHKFKKGTHGKPNK